MLRTILALLTLLLAAVATAEPPCELTDFNLECKGSSIQVTWDYYIPSGCELVGFSLYRHECLYHPGQCPPHECGDGYAVWVLIYEGTDASYLDRPESSTPRSEYCYQLLMDCGDCITGIIAIQSPDGRMSCP